MILELIILFVNEIVKSWKGIGRVAHEKDGTGKDSLLPAGRRCLWADDWVAHLVGIVGLDGDKFVPRHNLPADRTEVGDVLIACEETGQSLNEFPCHFGTTSWIRSDDGGREGTLRLPWRRNGRAFCDMRRKLAGLTGWSL